MSAVKATTNGSKAFAAQAPLLSHLLTHGLSAEVKGLYTALYAVLGLSYDETIDQWAGPGSGATLQLSYTPRGRMGAFPVIRELLDGASISPITGTITQPGGAGTPWFYTPATAPNASTAAVVTGSGNMSTASLYGTPTSSGSPATPGTLNGLTLILLVNGKSRTLTFDNPLNPLNPPYVTTPGTVPVTQHTLLTQISAAFPDIVPTINGSNHLVLTNKFAGSTQTITVGTGTANTLLGLTSGQAVVTGTADVPAGALYGSGGTLAGGGTGLTLILNVNGAGAVTMTFDGTGVTNDATEAAMLAAIRTTWPALTVSVGGSGGNKLVLTDGFGVSPVPSIVVGSGTANTALGLTAATTTQASTAGTGHSFAVVYEVDGTQLPNANIPVTGEAYSGGPGTGSPVQIED